MAESQNTKWITKLSKTVEQVRALVARGEVRVSLHGYEELATPSERLSSLTAFTVSRRSKRESYFTSLCPS